MLFLIKLFLKNLCLSRRMGLGDKVLKSMLVSFSLKPFLKRLVIKLFLKKFVIEKYNMLEVANKVQTL